MKNSKIYLEKLQTKKELYQLSEFVVYQNYDHHVGNKRADDYISEVFSVYKEEEFYFKNSLVYIAKNNLGKIVGAIRALKWNYTDVLPIQKLFNVDLQEKTSNQGKKPVWHIGRFAIKKGVEDFTLFKRLMICAIEPICSRKEGVAYAECDRKLLRVMRLMGIKAEVMGESINYLGSETIPVSMTYEGLSSFYKKNRFLMTDYPENLAFISS